MDAHKHDEELVRSLNDSARRGEYAAPFDHYKTGIIARILGALLIHSGTLIYGHKPSHAKFKAIEVIARIPYQSWELGAYTLMTALYSNEKRAIALSKLNLFSRVAQDNETMHVVVLSQMVKRMRSGGFIRHTLIPFIFAFFYFWIVYVLFLFSRRAALDLNYLFESHAYAQYSEFLKNEEPRLRQTPVTSEFLTFYGRHVNNEYEFFESVRNDELIHRNRSAQESYT